MCTGVVPQHFCAQSVTVVPVLWSVWACITTANLISNAFNQMLILTFCWFILQRNLFCPAFPPKAGVSSDAPGREMCSERFFLCPGWWGLDTNMLIFLVTQKWNTSSIVYSTKRNSMLKDSLRMPLVEVALVFTGICSVLVSLIAYSSSRTELPQ